jgi:hypothetical protein
MRLFLAGLVLLALSLGSGHVQAQTAWWQPSEIRVGFAAHDVKPISAGIEPGAALNGELFLQPVLRTGDGMLTLTPSLGGSASLSGDTSYGFVDLNAELKSYDPFFFDIGGGLAVHDGYDRAAPGRKDLGSRVLFHVSADVGARLTDHLGLSIYFDHLSNARLFGHTNQGLETIGLRVAWLF